MKFTFLRAAALPHSTRLYSDFLERFERVKPFYRYSHELSAILRSARAASVNPATRKAVVEVLRQQNRSLGAGAATEANLDRLADGAVAVVTGQQVGLFGGPAYSFYKAMTAIRIAEELTRRGVPAVPVFWLATEDHDLAEINHCFWLTREELRRLELASPAEAEAHRVGEVALGKGIEPLLAEAVQSLTGPSASDIAAALGDAYRPEATFGTAFGKLFARLLGHRGMLLLNPLDERLHRLTLGVYRRTIEESESLIGNLIARGKKLEQAGYHVQVKVNARSSLLFLNLDGRRIALRRRNGKFSAGERQFSAAELTRLLDVRPQDFTANVLLRPVIQDALLPTAAYVAGPAEIAYWAQSAVLYDQLRQPMPAVVPRAGFTFIEPPIARLMKKYLLSIEDLFAGKQALRRKLERNSIPKGLAGRFAKGENEIRRLIAGARKPLGKLDRTLIGAAGTAERKMLYQWNKLREKAGRAENFRSGVLDRQERQLLDSLFPHHGLQERSLCLLPLLAGQGLDVLGALEKHALEGDKHWVVSL